MIYPATRRQRVSQSESFLKPFRPFAYHGSAGGLASSQTTGRPRPHPSHVRALALCPLLSSRVVTLSSILLLSGSMAPHSVTSSCQHGGEHCGLVAGWPLQGSGALGRSVGERKRINTSPTAVGTLVFPHLTTSIAPRILPGFGPTLNPLAHMCLQLDFWRFPRSKLK